MRVAKLQGVRVQPVFVVVDTETHDVESGPEVQPATIPASALADIGRLIDGVRQQIEQGLAVTYAPDPDRPWMGTVTREQVGAVDAE